MLEGGSIKCKLQKIFRGTQTAWNKVQNQQLMQQRRLLIWLLVLRLKTLRLDKQQPIFWRVYPVVKFYHSQTSMETVFV